MRKLVKIVLTPVIALVALELSVRGLFWIKGEPYDAAVFREALAHDSEWMGNGSVEDGTEGTREREFVLQPFYGWDTEASQSQVEEHARYFRSPASAHSFDILVVGSSLGAGFANQGRQRFLEVLREEPCFKDAELRIYKYARGAFKEPQQLMVLCYLLSLGFEPDAVISIDGFNEAAFAITNHDLGVHPLHPAIGEWAPLMGHSSTDSLALEMLVEVEESQSSARRMAKLGRRVSFSCILAKLCLIGFDRHRARFVDAQHGYVERVADTNRSIAGGPRFEGDADDAIRLSVAAWSRSTRMMNAICEDRSISFLSVLQPNQHAPGARPMTDTELARSKAPKEWIESAQIAYPLIRKKGRKLGAHGVHFLDASTVFKDIDEAVYRDFGHLTRRGHEILGELIGRRFLEARESE